jgi:sarcosine oxidase subunit beta
MMVRSPVELCWSTAISALRSSASELPSSPTVETADYVVVGGGVHGCAAAWELARRGREVVLLEAGRVAGGASGGVGQRGVRANGRDPRELSLLRRAYALWPDLADAIGVATGFARIGHLQLLDREDDPAAAHVQVETQRAHGIETELLDGERLREFEPDLAPLFEGAISCPLDGVADHGATTTGWCRAAQREGAAVHERTSVTALRAGGGRVTSLVTAAGEQIEVGEGVIVLANTGAASILKPLGVELPTFAVFPQALVTEPIDRVPAHHIVAHPRRRLSLKPLPDGAVMITGEWLGRPDGAGRGVVDPAQRDSSLAAAADAFPSLRDVTLAHATADRAEAATPDLVPIIDAVPGAANVLFATGWSGHGFAMAPAVAELLADWAITGERPELFRPFGLDRFR